LTAATRNGAEALRIIDKVGTITEGKFADLVVLDGDFLQDFSALYRTVAVLNQVELYTEFFPHVDAWAV
jgi:imidazolonepropionase-like amidohydrolase